MYIYIYTHVYTPPPFFGEVKVGATYIHYFGVWPIPRSYPDIIFLVIHPTATISHGILVKSQFSYLCRLTSAIFWEFFGVPKMIFFPRCPRCLKNGQGAKRPTWETQLSIRASLYHGKNMKKNAKMQWCSASSFLWHGDYPDRPLRSFDISAASELFRFCYALLYHDEADGTLYLRQNERWHFLYFLWPCIELTTTGQRNDYQYHDHHDTCILLLFEYFWILLRY